ASCGARCRLWCRRHCRLRLSWRIHGSGAGTLAGWQSQPDRGGLLRQASREPQYRQNAGGGLSLWWPLMKTQQHRLPAGTKVFAGLNIDRTQTLRFRLDGRLISGFAGDTVLSALLASGVDTLGEHLDTALGLSAASAPAILPSSQAADPRHALPMDRTPALDGADYVTLRGRRRNPFIRLFQPGRSLGLVLDTPGALDRPWRTWAGEASAHQDMVIVGGGVAGL